MARSFQKGTSRSKYGARGEHVNGRWCASKKEARRYRELLLLEQGGAISNLVPQRPFDLHTTTPAGARVKIGRYIADFVYRAGGVDVVEDTKGFKTELYLWKKRHVEAEYGLRIVET